MVMQLSVPNGPQPTQNPPMVQWNPCKYYSLEQRPNKPGELYKPDSGPQVGGADAAQSVSQLLETSRYSTQGWSWFSSVGLGTCVLSLR